MSPDRSGLQNSLRKQFLQHIEEFCTKKALDYNQPRNSYVKNEVAQKLLHSFVQAGTQLSSQMDFCSLFYSHAPDRMYEYRT